MSEIPPGDLDDSEVEAEESPKTEKLCACNNVIPIDATACPFCKKPQQDALIREIKASESKVCPTCGQVVK